MTHLRKMMLEELDRRNYAQTTIDCYMQTIKKAWSVADTPYPKKTRPLPSILSPEEVAHLIDSSQTRFHRMVLMTLYGAGVRRAELARLQISDIDSRRMVIHIRSGKGRQDRDIMLSPRLLEALRDYWRGLKRKPAEWLFPGGSRHTSNRPITPRAVWRCAGPRPKITIPRVCVSAHASSRARLR